jgi:hypothetical protein
MQVVSYMLLVLKGQNWVQVESPQLSDLGTKRGSPSRSLVVASKVIGYLLFFSAIPGYDGIFRSLCNDVCHLDVQIYVLFFPPSTTWKHNFP